MVWRPDGDQRDPCRVPGHIRVPEPSVASHASAGRPGAVPSPPCAALSAVQGRHRSPGRIELDRQVSPRTEHKRGGRNAWLSDGLGRFADPWLLVLTSVADGPKHGYTIMADIAGFSGVAWSRAPCTGRCPGWNAAAGSGRWPPPDAAARTRPKLLGDGMSSTALTWAFASWVAKSSGYMLTSANVIIVSGRGRGFSVQKKRALISVLAGQDRDITQSYSNFGLGHRGRAGDPGRAGHHDAADRARRPAAHRHGLGSVMWPGRRGGCRVPCRSGHYVTPEVR